MNLFPAYYRGRAVIADPGPWLFVAVVLVIILVGLGKPPVFGLL